MSGYLREGHDKVLPKKRKKPLHRIPDKAPYSQCVREGNEAVPVTGMLNGGRNAKTD